jgi:hypothetical protein
MRTKAQRLINHLRKILHPIRHLINNQRTLALFNYTRKAGLKFSLFYEDATIQAEINGGTMNGINVTAVNAIAHAQQTLLYAQTNFFNDPSFFRLSNAPVFLNFGPQYFHTNSGWISSLSVLNATKPAGPSSSKSSGRRLGDFRGCSCQPCLPAVS